MKFLFRASNAKNFFLQKLESLRKYCFALLCFFREKGDCKIRGFFMYRGKEMPKVKKVFFMRIRL